MGGYWFNPPKSSKQRPLCFAGAILTSITPHFNLSEACSRRSSSVTVDVVFALK